MTGRKNGVSPLRLGWHLGTYQPGRWLINVASWTTIWVIPIIPGLITKWFFDNLTGASTSGFSIPTLAAFLIGYGLARVSVIAFGMWNDAHFQFRNDSLLRRNMLAGVFDRPGAEAITTSPGEAITRFRDDVDEVTETMGWTADLIGLALFSVVSMAILASIDPWVTFIVFAPTVVVIAIAAQMRHRIRRYREAARDATGVITEALGETFGSVQAIKVAGAEESMVDHFRVLNERRKGFMVRDKVLSTSLESVFWNTVNIGTGLVLLAAARAMSAGTFTVGDFALFTYCLGFVTDAVFVLGLFIARYQQAAVSFERIGAVPMSGSADDMVQHRDLYLSGPLPELSTAAVDEPLRSIAIEGLTYRYSGGNGIENIDLEIRRGDFVVVTGKVGAGKTTLLRALLGLVTPQAGQILWNGAVVEDPAEFFVPPRSAYTPQVPRLFSMALRDNIVMGASATDADVAEAIEAAVLEHDLDAMPAGLDTLVGPMGVRLSGGQIQRTAAARMFVRTPELLVFDDLSSALDVETERVLWERLAARRSGVTSLVVSHREPALQRATTVVVMDGGRVVAKGTLEEVAHLLG